MTRSLIVKLVKRRAARREEEKNKEERIKHACGFEERMLAHGMSLDDLNYYTLPFHESEACEALGDKELCEEFLEGARLWFEVTAHHGVESACELLRQKELQQ